MDKVKVRLKCVFGDNSPETVMELDEKVAEVLLADGNAILADESDEKDPSVALKVIIAALNEELASVKKDLETAQADNLILTTEVETLKGAKDGKASSGK